MLILKSHYRVINKATSLILFVCAICCIAGESQAYKTRAEIEAKAKAGDREAMFDHANCNFDPICPGYTVRNVPEAIKWFERAARKGQRDANLMLGVILCGEPGFQNQARGRKYLDKAIELGLGTMARPAKNNCGKGNGGPGLDPDIIVKGLNETHKSREKIIQMLTTAQKKGLITDELYKARVEFMKTTPSEQMIFLFLGYANEGLESLLTLFETGKCDTALAHKKIIVDGMQLPPDKLAKALYKQCGSANFKKELEKIKDPSFKAQLLDFVFNKTSKKQNEKFWENCLDKKYVRNFIKVTRMLLK
jgi:TPR repeat protein